MLYCVNPPSLLINLTSARPARGRGARSHGVRTGKGGQKLDKRGVVFGRFERMLPEGMMAVYWCRFNIISTRDQTPIYGGRDSFIGTERDRKTEFGPINACHDDMDVKILVFP